MRTIGLAVLCVAALFGQAGEGWKVEKIGAGYKFTEGPVWSREGFLLFSDVPADRILKLTPGKPIEAFREASNGANGNTFDAQGRLYTCESRTRRLVRSKRGGAIEVLAERWEGKRLNAPNDVVVRRDGHVYFTDPAFGKQADTRELDFYGVYHIPPRGPMELVARCAWRPNGVTLSPDGKILYVADSDGHRVVAWDVDRAGKAANERTVISGIDGVPDGIRTDEKGSLYVTARQVFVYAPAGKLEHTIEIGETPANCAWGDADLQSLYITARTSVYRARLKVKGSVQY